MSANDAGGAGKPPALQGLYDNLMLMLVLGLGVPGLLYTVWGLIEVIRVPAAK